MNRNESYPASGVAALDVNLAWATLELVTDSVQDVQVLVSGNESDVDDLRTGLENGKLTVEQPAYGLTPRIAVVRWMQVVVRLPETWKGVIEAGTVAGCLRAVDLTGSDMALTTVSGDLSGSNLSAINLRARTVTGALNLVNVGAEQATVRTVSGLMHLHHGDFRQLRINSAASDVELDLDAPFDRLDVTTVAGDIRVLAPIRMGNITLRSATGRLRTNGVSITDEGPVLAASTVSGSLQVTCKEQ